MDMLNSVDVDTMLMKRRQKFFDDFEHLDNLLCQITMSLTVNRPIMIFSERTTLRSLYAISRPSVCLSVCLSVCCL